MDLQIKSLTSAYLNKELRDFLNELEDYEEKLTPFQHWLNHLKTQAAKHLELDLTNPLNQLDWPMMLRVSTLEKFEKELDVTAFATERESFLTSLRDHLSAVIAKPQQPNDRAEAISGLRQPEIALTPFGPLSRNDNTTYVIARSALGTTKQSLYDQIVSLLTASLGTQALSAPETGYLFENMIAQLPRDFNHDAYPNVKRFIGTLILQSELKADLLMKEVEHLTYLLNEKLATNNQERQLVALLNDYRLLKRLFALELTPGDFEHITKMLSPALYRHPRESGDPLFKVPNSIDSRLRGNDDKDENIFHPSTLIQRFLSLNQEGRVKDLDFSHLEEIDALFDKALAFYHGAKARDQWMLQNIESRLKETNFDKAVVITGGFHSGPFQEYFQSRGYNYALISPKITTTEGREQYIDSFLKYRNRPQKTSTIKDFPRVPLTTAQINTHEGNPGLIAADLHAELRDLGMPVVVIDSLDYFNQDVEPRSEVRRETQLTLKTHPKFVDAPVIWLSENVEPRDVRRFLSQQTYESFARSEVRTTRRDFLAALTFGAVLAPTVPTQLFAQARAQDFSATTQAKATALGMFSLIEGKTGLVVDKARIDARGNVLQLRSSVDFMKTSPTNMGLGIVSVIIARDQGWIEKEEATEKLTRMVSTLEKMKRYRGFWYNWYNLASLDARGAPHVTLNRFLSSVDNANLTASLMVLHEAVDGTALAGRAQTLLDAQDWNFFYNKKEGLVSHGYDVAKRTYSAYDYGTFNTEARLLSFISVLGGVDQKAWDNMSREVLADKSGKILVAAAWGGSLFETLFPDIFIHAAGAIAQNNRDMVTIHRNKAEELGFKIWGWSPALNADGVYREAAVPEVGAQGGGKGYPVGAVSPYSSLLAGRYASAAVIGQNLANMRALNPAVYSPKFGYRDAIDPKTGRVAPDILSLDKGMEMAGFDMLFQTARKQPGTAGKYFWRYLSRKKVATRARALLDAEDGKIAAAKKQFLAGQGETASKFEFKHYFLDDVARTSREGAWDNRSGISHRWVVDKNQEEAVFEIVYDVSTNGSFGGTFHKPRKPVDPRTHKATHVVIPVRGVGRKGAFTSTFKIELKRGGRSVQIIVIKGVTNQWQQFAFPLKANLGPIDEVVTVFESIRADVKEGTIRIKNITLAAEQKTDQKKRSEVRQAVVTAPDSQLTLRANSILTVPFIALATKYMGGVVPVEGRPEVRNQAVLEVVVKRFFVLAGFSVALQARQQNLNAKAQALFSKLKAVETIREASRQATEPQIVTFQSKKPRPDVIDVANVLFAFENPLNVLYVPLIGATKLEVKDFKTKLAERAEKLGYHLNEMNVFVVAVPNARQLPSLTRKWAREHNARARAIVSEDAARHSYHRDTLRLLMGEVSGPVAVALAVKTIRQLDDAITQIVQNAKNLQSNHALQALATELLAIRQFLVAA